MQTCIGGFSMFSWPKKKALDTMLASDVDGRTAPTSIACIFSLACCRLWWCVSSSRYDVVVKFTHESSALCTSVEFDDLLSFFFHLLTASHHLIFRSSDTSSDNDEFQSLTFIYTAKTVVGQWLQSTYSTRSHTAEDICTSLIGVSLSFNCQANIECRAKLP